MMDSKNVAEATDRKWDSQMIRCCGDRRVGPVSVSCRVVMVGPDDLLLRLGGLACLRPHLSRCDLLATSVPASGFSSGFGLVEARTAARLFVGSFDSVLWGFRVCEVWKIKVSDENPLLLPPLYRVLGNHPADLLWDLQLFCSSYFVWWFLKLGLPSAIYPMLILLFSGLVFK